MHLCLPPQAGHGLTPGSLRRSLVRCLAAVLLLAGCQPPGAPDVTDAVELSWSIEPQPPAVGPARLSLTLTEAAAQPVTGAAVKLEANMSHPGMRPVFGTAEEVAPGRYLVPFELTMAGDWILLVDAALRDGRALRRQVDLRGVRPR